MALEKSDKSDTESALAEGFIGLYITWNWDSVEPFQSCEK